MLFSTKHSASGSSFFVISQFLFSVMRGEKALAAF